MSEPRLTCTACGRTLPLEVLSAPDFVHCPSCGVAIRVEVFPAFRAGVAAGPLPEPLLSDDEAGCFYHPKKKAVVACERCGRFLCALCDVYLIDKHLCPPCIEAGKAKGTIPELQTERILYDGLALVLVFLCMPLALFVAIRYWNAPGSIVPRSKARFVLAVAVAFLQVAAVVTLIIYLTAR